MLGVDRPFSLLVEVHGHQVYFRTVVHQRHHRFLNISDLHRGLRGRSGPVWPRIVALRPLVFQRHVVYVRRPHLHRSFRFCLRRQPLPLHQVYDGVVELLLGDSEHLPQRQFHLAVEDSFFQDLSQVRGPFDLRAQPVSALLGVIPGTGLTGLVPSWPESGFVSL